MREQQVDELVVTERQRDASRPLGVVSAREIVTRVFALGLDPAVVTAGDLVWSPQVAAHITDSVTETLNRMCASSGETLPVVNSDGKVMGVVSLDDLLQALARSEPSRADRFRS